MRGTTALCRQNEPAEGRGPTQLEGGAGRPSTSNSHSIGGSPGLLAPSSPLMGRATMPISSAHPRVAVDGAITPRRINDEVDDNAVTAGGVRPPPKRRPRVYADLVVNAGCHTLSRTYPRADRIQVTMKVMRVRARWRQGRERRCARRKPSLASRLRRHRINSQPTSARAAGLPVGWRGPKQRPGHLCPPFK